MFVEWLWRYCIRGVAPICFFTCRTYGALNYFICIFYKRVASTMLYIILFVFSTNVSHLRCSKLFYLYFLQTCRTYSALNYFICIFYKRIGALPLKNKKINRGVAPEMYIYMSHLRCFIFFLFVFSTNVSHLRCFIFFWLRFLQTYRGSAPNK
jgi:hypothetical protein